MEAKLLSVIGWKNRFIFFEIPLLFESNLARNYDVIIFATGYKVDFPFLNNNNLPDVRNICFSDDKNVAYLGFVRPNVGAIPPMAELQVMWWLEYMK